MKDIEEFLKDCKVNSDEIIDTNDDSFWNLKDLLEHYKEQCVSINKNDSLSVDVYGTCDDDEGEVYALFESKERCEIEAEESGCEVKLLTLYKGERMQE